METLAPPVVAVVIAHDPGPWFDDMLASLGSQDYTEMSVLVLDSASAEDLTARVAARLPAAYVRRFDENRGYGPTSNEVRSMVDGAAYFLFCHDDIALYPDTVHLLVEEAFRSNAGIVAPKVVGWDDAHRLVHVGMTVDKSGSVVDRVQPNEIDHGQHDAVRDVFVAPGGCTLVRADLFEELGGFDPTIVAMGEDLDLCWRAQVAGARVIVAPDARVRHRGELASGSRPVPASLVHGSGETVPHRVTLQELQRRHELHSVLTCYGPFHLLRVLPQIILLNLAELVVAGIAGNRTRVRAVWHAWGWNLHHLGVTRRQRRRVQSHRRLSDKEIRQLQVGGSARLSAYARRVLQYGFRGAHADELGGAGGDGEGGVGSFLDEFDEFDEFDEGVEPAVVGKVVEGVPLEGVPLEGVRPELEGVRPEGDGSGPGPSRGRLSGTVRLLAWLAAALVVIVGSRSLLTGSIPSIGQFVSFPAWTSTFVQFAAGWHPSGVGSTAPASPAFALIGAVGTVLLGSMGLTQKVLIFGCIPVGAWGMVRLLRPFGSQRAALVAGVAYVALPLPYDALALGRFGTLVVYAGAPWVLGHLFRFTRISPYAPGPAGGGATSAAREARDEARPATAGAHREREGRRGSGARNPKRWLAGHRRLRSLLLLGVLEGVLVSFVPAAAVGVVLLGLAIAVSSLLLGKPKAAIRALWMAIGSTAVAGMLCLPWLIGVVTSGNQAINVLGVAMHPPGMVSWASLLRFSVGPIGDSPLAWGFGLAALLPIVLARGIRFSWAGRCWSIALVCWLAAWATGNGWTGRLAIDPTVLLAPAAAAVAMAIGLGIAAFEEDLRAAAFGWRQLATGAAVLALAVGTFPVLASALPGRWDLPQTDFSQTLSWMRGETASGAFRVLWLGDSGALNEGSWSAGDGLAYATSENGPPDATWLWNAPDPGPAAQLASAVDQARSGLTDQLGSLLAPAGVRYIVTVSALAPVIPMIQSPTRYALPLGLATAISRQLDLQAVFSETGISVYRNTAWVPERSEILAASPHAKAAEVAVAHGSTGVPDILGTPPGAAVVPGAVPILPGGSASRSYSGIVPVGTVISALAPSDRWKLDAPDGIAYPMSRAFGWEGQYQVDTGGPATLRFDGGPWAPLSVAFQLLLWFVVALALIERREVVRPLFRSLSRRRHRLDPRPLPEFDVEPDSEPIVGV